MGYIVADPKGCGFSDVFVINKVSILVDFSHFGHQQGIAFTLIWVCFEKKPLSRHYPKQNQQKLFTNYYDDYYSLIYYFFIQLVWYIHAVNYTTYIISYATYNTITNCVYGNLTLV